MILPIGEWVLREACRQLRRWHDAGFTRLRVAVNLSAEQFQQANLVAMVKSALEGAGIDPSQLVLELTESSVMRDAERSVRVLTQLSALGVQISVDDFGTGYSSLSYLRRLPTQQLKIDRSFVQDLEESADARAIVNAVVRLAHALGRKVVAEGVETEGQHDILRGFGCDELQGFLFARPMPATQVSLWAIGEDTAPQEFRPSIFDDRAPSLSRVPWHSGQGWKVTARSTKARMCGCMASGSLESIDFWILGTRPS